MAVSYKRMKQNIRRARTAARMTQEKAAEKMGISLLHYGRLERCDRRVSIEQIDAMAVTFGVPPQALLEGVLWEANETEDESQERLTAIQKLTLLMESCPPQEQELCLDICRRIVCGKGRPG